MALVGYFVGPGWRSNPVEARTILLVAAAGIYNYCLSHAVFPSPLPLVALYKFLRYGLVEHLVGIWVTFRLSVMTGNPQLHATGLEPRNSGITISVS